jgi:hypothetical protein
MRLLRNPARTVILWSVLCGVAASFLADRATRVDFWPGWGAWIAYGFGPLVVVWVLGGLVIIWLWRHR